MKLKTKVLIFLPTAIIFLFPWFHHLQVVNLMWAVPEMSLENAHEWSIAISVMVGLILIPIIAEMK